MSGRFLFVKRRPEMTEHCPGCGKTAKPGEKSYYHTSRARLHEMGRCEECWFAQKDIYPTGRPT